MIFKSNNAFNRIDEKKRKSELQIHTHRGRKLGDNSWEKMIRSHNIRISCFRWFDIST